MVVAAESVAAEPMGERGLIAVVVRSSARSVSYVAMVVNPAGSVVCVASSGQCESVRAIRVTFSSASVTSDGAPYLVTLNQAESRTSVGSRGPSNRVMTLLVSNGPRAHALRLADSALQKPSEMLAAAVPAMS